MDNNGQVKDLRKMTREELYELAKELNIKGRSTLSKGQLIANINQLREQALEKTRKSSSPPTSTLAPIARGKPSAKKDNPTLKSKPTVKQLVGSVVEASGKPFQPVKPPDTSRVSEARLTGELPWGYGDNKITLQVRDPYWAHAYWEIADNVKNKLRQDLGDEGYTRSIFVLRIYDVTNVNFDGLNAHSYYDVHIFEGASNWYLHLQKPNCSYIVDLGIITPSGEFILIARSNRINTPRDTFSDTIDDQWMVVDSTFQEIYRLSGGLSVGASSGEIKQAMSKRLMQELSSGAVSSLSSPVRQYPEKEKAKDFWLVVNTELIVYGATEADANLTVQGKPVQLRPDGTFTLRFALPDGNQKIPVRAVNSDGDMERTITPVVEKSTF